MGGVWDAAQIRYRGPRMWAMPRCWIVWVKRSTRSSGESSNILNPFPPTPELSSSFKTSTAFDFKSFFALRLRLFLLYIHTALSCFVLGFHYALICLSISLHLLRIHALRTASFPCMLWPDYPSYKQEILF